MTHIDVGRVGRPRVSDTAKRSILPEYPDDLNEMPALRITQGVPAESTANMRAGYFLRSIWAVIMAALIWSQAAQVQAAVDRDQQTLVEQINRQITLITGTATKIGGAFSGIKGTIDAATLIGDLLGVYTPFSQEEAFKELHKKLDELATKLDTQARALDWKIDVNNQDRRLSQVFGPVLTAESASKLKMPFTLDTDGVGASLSATDEAGSGHQFERFFVESVTGQKGTGWKAYISDRPEVHNNYVYDWRLGVPALMQLISLRLMIIAAVDPNFTHDTAFRTELLKHRDALLRQYKKMTDDGVKCNRSHSVDTSDSPWWYFHEYIVACADIHVGTSAISDPFYFYSPYPLLEYDPSWQPFVNTEIEPAEKALRRQVLLTMPLFGMRSMIDMLYLYANGGPDLTNGKEFIQVAAAPDLCLEVKGGNPTPGTPVQISYCDGGFAQQWVYDRQSGTIRNPVYDKCLDVQGVNPAPGIPVQIWDCYDGPAQKWTYDPETQVLQNALATVLDIQWGALQAETPVWTWDRNEGPAQRWLSH